MLLGASDCKSEEQDNHCIAHLINLLDLHEHKVPLSRFGDYFINKPHRIFLKIFDSWHVYLAFKNTYTHPKDINLFHEKTKKRKSVYNGLKQKAKDHNEHNPLEPKIVKNVMVA